MDKVYTEILTVRNGERVAIDIHCGVLFVTCKMMVVLYELYVKIAGWPSTKKSAPTPVLVSGTVDFVRFQ